MGLKNEGSASGPQNVEILEVKDSGKIGDGTDIQCCPQMGHLLLLDDDVSGNYAPCITTPTR